MSDTNFTPQPGAEQPAAYPAQQPAPGLQGYAAAPQQGYAAPQPGYAQPGYAAAPQKTSVMAILALIFGILVAPVGIVLGHIALKQLKTSGEGGEGLAKAGLIIGYIFFALWILINIVGVITALAGASSSYGY
ncbi:hypothetical protein M2390_002791 [Mycetocola sp. BIGb0189]|uniref:DUF4190 domain-containing protein n=1 Tax=Mycetocola sp. BIGb0189 TaxID=2940604 RepID=UPI002167B92C|nr:DUF4190 domain-containing protein [Mycetocola sp. BIGb0189]MCS4277582.1 hypothetical protein [Mycetocola sp. BIGb0189]